MIRSVKHCEPIDAYMGTHSYTHVYGYAHPCIHRWTRLSLCTRWANREGMGVGVGRGGGWLIDIHNFARGYQVDIASGAGGLSWQSFSIHYVFPSCIKFFYIFSSVA